MRRPAFAALSAAALLCLSGVAFASPAVAAPGGHRNVEVCSTASVGEARCQAVRSDPLTAAGVAAPEAAGKTPTGYGPADIRAAYALNDNVKPTVVSGGRTVAIVDAYDAPTAEADLAVYRKHFGLPPCTTANGCFTKVSQTGSRTNLPRADGGWAQEISLDLDMVSATCPDCKILLVEAKSASFKNLAAAVKFAATRGVAAISNSYGGTDFPGTGSTAAAYDQPGIAVTAASGDFGFGVSAPASFPTVIAVGGTSLVKNPNGTWSETAWAGSGSGCSTLNPKPSYQVGTGCPGKATSDVSAVADPNTGVAVYDSFAFQGYKGWLQFGGTSASSPIIASVYAMGTAVTLGGDIGAYTWKHSTHGLNDVVGGSNGSCPTPSWCTSVPGWDGPTGLGTPHGTAAF
jgi:subtilase family serine protease